MICPDCGNLLAKNSYFDAFYCPRCGGMFKEKKLMTNADRIRAMSDEELRFVLVRDCPKGVTHEVCSTLSCENCWLWWLQQPVED